MITILAMIAVVIIGYRADKLNNQDRERIYDRTPIDETKYFLLLHIRQDVKLICFLLYPIIILLAIIADALVFMK